MAGLQGFGGRASPNPHTLQDLAEISNLSFARPLTEIDLYVHSPWYKSASLELSDRLNLRQDNVLFLLTGKQASKKQASKEARLT